MKNILTILAVAALCSFNHAAFAQSDADAANLVAAAKSSGDSQLGDIASELTSKTQALVLAAGGSSAVTGQLDSTLKSLTGGNDSSALTSAFGLVKNAKFTPEQLGLAKQVGNLTSAYVVQKNFSSLDGQQGDVATIVNSLRGGKIKDALPALKNIASSAKLSDTQKQLITTVADKYVPGLGKASSAMNEVKKLPGF